MGPPPSSGCVLPSAPVTAGRAFPAYRRWPRPAGTGALVRMVQMPVPVQLSGSVTAARRASSRRAAWVARSSVMRWEIWSRCWLIRPVTCWQGACPASRMARMPRISARLSPAAWASRMKPSRAAVPGG